MKGQYKYQDYSGVVSNTIPGRCYSISELLQRVLAGQPLPQIGKYEEDNKSYTDKEIEKQMDIDASNPLADKDADIIEADNTKSAIDEHIELVKSSKKS